MCTSRSLKVNEEILGDKETCQQLVFVRIFLKGTCTHCSIKSNRC